MTPEVFTDASIRASTPAWWSTHGRIWPKDRSAGLLTPRPNYLQRLTARVVEKMQADGLPVRVIGLKPRQRGSSTYFTAEGYARLRRSPCAGMIIGGQFTQTDQLWGMLQTYQGNDTFDGWGNTGVINEREGNWSHGSTLKKETAGDVHAGIAGTYQMVHVTELGRWPNEGKASAGAVLANTLKAVPLIPDTIIIIESTAEGDTSRVRIHCKLQHTTHPTAHPTAHPAHQKSQNTL